MGRALDNVPPSNVTLTVERGKHSLKIFWTDTGDDTTDGTAGKYEFRWSSTTSLSSEGTFSGGTWIPLSAPEESGTEHCMVFDGLTQNHDYYFAMKLMDKEFNWSGIGYLNTSTLASPNIEVSDCPAPGRPSEGGGGEEGLIAPGELASSGLPKVIRAEWALGSARPNPTSGRTTIQYSMKTHGPVRIALYDVAGRLVRTLVNEIVDVGPHAIEWDGRSDAGDRVGSGVYYYRMITGDWRSNRQLVVVPN